ncbi:AAA family ATPase [Desertifilum sp. FACHB-1129]|uniref:ATPase n=2 Tax=Desertifilum tharense IPPAS B-1220 TaxID=1781255 RepID=A0A1E5QR11_9CYAN|nr:MULTISPECIES: ATP-binding protein [Desertifilum]MDA0210794.1 AAA family ATPase [Cyanobacteria bacterium FC1]MBD2312280.1 AAA family ATPase [Desertifilum sp. FACHB-1129]MBD2323653.1 AAA family ATPase [Desertifilum sp. FACHB-866]MBD2332350.1 AAA family ATPase [Desertifilum sp. FACHB-868]OEJ77044.1 ATPase [Desertifilum tharense IPPAS B-1220]
MLKSFQIQNFRLFQHLEVSKLGRVNLIVGKNNSGKSTFLEAVAIYASNAFYQVLLDLIESRQETWLRGGQIYSPSFFMNPIRHLFFGRKLPNIEENGIVLGEIESGNNIHLSVAAYQNKQDNEGTLRKIRTSETEIDDDLSNLEFFLIVEEGKRTRRLFGLDKNIKDIRRSYTIYERMEPDLKYIWQLVRTENVSDRKLAALWDLTSLTDLESEVISALRLIDNRVSGVAFVEDISRSRTREPDNRIPLVKIKDIDEPLPLKSMGDGMSRLFHIVVALVNSRNGLLLIDEFENGLHWSVQPLVWEIVFQLSEKLNVQVFATTHSRDCIEGFDKAWNKYPELGAFFRLDVKGNSIKATEYTSETLTDAIDMDVEVR